MNLPKLRFKEFDGEWGTTFLEQAIDVKSGKDYKHLDKGNIPVYGTGGYMLSVNDYLSEKDAIGIGRKGSIDKPQKLIAPFWTVDTLFYCLAKNNNDLSFLFTLFQKIPWKKFDESTGVPSLSKSTIGKIKISLPIEKEQKKIGDFFEMINKKIQLQQQKIDLLQEQKKGYMQMIFNQEIQFKEENDGNHHEWREVAISDILILHLREIPKPNESYIRLGLRSHAKGTFHEVINNPQNVNMDKLFVVHEGDFIINITFAWEQALAIADKEDHGKLVSHRFPTYRFTEGHYSGFYKYYFTTKYFKYCLGNASPGGAGRNRVLNKKDFMNIRIKVPKYDEQLEIAKFLFKLDQRIQLEQQKMNNLQEQKKGFMQQMFI